MTTTAIPIDPILVVEVFVFDFFGNGNECELKKEGKTETIPT